MPCMIHDDEYSGNSNGISIKMTPVPRTGKLKIVRLTNASDNEVKSRYCCQVQYSSAVDMGRTHIVRAIIM